MTTRIHRSIAVPVRRSVGELSWDERWHGPDQGLIICWEAGRELREQDPPLAARAEAGELVSLPWNGGTERSKWGEGPRTRTCRERARRAKKPKYGPLMYLAMWQGLRGEDLDIDLDAEREIRCSRRDRHVIFRRLGSQNWDSTTSHSPASAPSDPRVTH
jgi:hypothetical protein